MNNALYNSDSDINILTTFKFICNSHISQQSYYKARRMFLAHNINGLRNMTSSTRFSQHILRTIRTEILNQYYQKTFK